MENIDHFLKACTALGVHQSDLFNTVDLFEEKNLSLVINSIIVLGNLMNKQEYYNGPRIQDSSKTTNLWSESLVMVEMEDENNVVPVELGPEEQELVDWINEQLERVSPSTNKINNITTDLRSGVVLLTLVEGLTGLKSDKWERSPKYLVDYIKNSGAVLTLLMSITFDKIPCQPRDVVNMNTPAVKELIKYMRDKFDLNFLFEKILNEELDENEQELYSDMMEYDTVDGWEELEGEYTSMEGFYDEDGSVLWRRRVGRIWRIRRI